MHRTIVLLVGLATGLSLAPLGAQATADDLLARLDRNETSTSGHSIGTITVQDRFGLKVSSFESWSQGTDKSLVVFTAGEEKGQKILRLKDTIYVSYPEADKPVKLQGAALKDSVAGSDFSYEDMAGDRSLASRYTAKIVGQEDLGGEACTILELRAKKPGLAYPLVKVWVAAAGDGRRLERYSQNERLLKTQEVLAVTKTAGRTVATKLVLSDALKGKSQTQFELSKVELDVAVPAAKFSLEELAF
jgi:outer membrane lipoprotein-sorting protein